MQDLKYFLTSCWKPRTSSLVHLHLDHVTVLPSPPNSRQEKHPQIGLLILQPRGEVQAQEMAEEPTHPTGRQRIHTLLYQEAGSGCGVPWRAAVPEDRGEA